MPDRPPISIGAVLLATFAGASIWISLAQVGLLDGPTRDRVASLPPLWALAVLIIGAALAAARARLPVTRLWPCAAAAILWLPYLPGRVPAAFFIWDGNVEPFVWLLVGAGLLFANPPVSLGAGRLAANPRRAPWLAAAIAAAASTLGAWSLGDLLPGGDEPHYLVITQSLLLDGDLKIENNHRRGDPLRYTRQTLRPHFIQRGQDGEIYSIHSPGVAVLILPGFALAGYAGAVATTIALSAAASALAWHAAWLLTSSAAGAWAGWAAAALTTPFYFHSFTIYPEAAGGLFIMAAVWLLVRLEMRLPVTTRHLLLIGAGLGLLPWLHTRFVPIAAALGGVLALRLLGDASARTRVARLMAVPAVMAAAWFAYFWIIWGSPNPSVPHGRETVLAVERIGTGLIGLLFDQQFGLLSHAPILVAAVAGLALLTKIRTRLAVELLVVIVPYAVAAASFTHWWGGASAPARLLAAVVPVAALTLALWWRDRAAASWRAMTSMLLLLSVAIAGQKLAAANGRLTYNDRDGYDVFLDWVADGVDLPMAFPGILRGVPGAALVEPGAWILAGLLAVTAVIAIDRARRPSRGAVWAISMLSGMVVLMLAATSVWTYHGVDGVRAELSQANFVRWWNPLVRGTAVRIDPLERLTLDDALRRIEFRNADRVEAEERAPILLRAPNMPAGDYELVTQGDATVRGQVTVSVGRIGGAVEHWQLDGREAGRTGITLRLPVPVHSITIRGDEEARAATPEVRLRVRSLRANPALGSVARRAVRYGGARAFFMDDSSYEEEDGFWIRGEESTTVVLDTDEPEYGGELTLRLRAGPVPTTATVSMESWSRQLDFEPHQELTIALPEPHGSARVVTLHAGAWFRPSEHDPASTDIRRLGVFVEFP